ncbi:MAG: hypothetical protein J0G32_01325 [Alphaproteobacteria bacterium]|nr:hypothetical protein [Alphaproteobacteria bacterium]OJV13192.1 MAG: hypothetical protein BGO27_00105 [Alphaproteobacteria bacterium 33-17]
MSIITVSGDDAAINTLMSVSDFLQNFYITRNCYNNKLAKDIENDYLTNVFIKEAYQKEGFHYGSDIHPFLRDVVYGTWGGAAIGHDISHNTIGKLLDYVGFENTSNYIDMAAAGTGAGIGLYVSTFVGLAHELVNAVGHDTGWFHI